MKALITGGAGFIGYHLAKELLHYDYSVTLVDNFERGVEDSSLIKLKEDERVEILSLDLLQPESLEKVEAEYDIIFHLAAIIGVQNVINRPAEVLRNNIVMLFNIIDFAKKNKNLKRLVFASTSEIYAGTLQYYDMEIPTPENTPLTLTNLAHPRTSYMLSKIYGEAVLNQSGLPFTIIRPHNFYGPRMGMSHVIPELLRKAWFNEGKGKLEVFSPYHKRTFCYISDAVTMIRMLAESPNSLSQAYNVGNQEPEIYIRDVAEIILKTVNRPYDIYEREAAVGSPERRCPDMKKTLECINYIPQVTLEDGIQKTFNWYQKYIFSGMENGAK